MSADANHDTVGSDSQQREGVNSDGVVIIAPNLVDQILAFGPVFTKTSDGVAVCVTAQRMLTRGQIEFLNTDTLQDIVDKTIASTRK